MRLCAATSSAPAEMQFLGQGSAGWKTTDTCNIGARTECGLRRGRPVDGPCGGSGGGGASGRPRQIIVADLIGDPGFQAGAAEVEASVDALPMPVLIS